MVEIMTELEAYVHRSGLLPFQTSDQLCPIDNPHGRSFPVCRWRRETVSSWTWTDHGRTL